jgi:hypothetical protein
MSKTTGRSKRDVCVPQRLDAFDAGQRRSRFHLAGNEPLSCRALRRHDKQVRIQDRFCPRDNRLAVGSSIPSKPITNAIDIMSDDAA